MKKISMLMDSGTEIVWTPGRIWWRLASGMEIGLSEDEFGDILERGSGRRNYCVACGHPKLDHDAQYGCNENGCECIERQR